MAVEKSICPNCQADSYGVDQCWLCHADLSPATNHPFVSGNPPIAPTLSTSPKSTVTGNADQRLAGLSPDDAQPAASNPYAPPVPIASEKNSSPFTIVLTIGLAMVFIALFVAAPGLAILLGVIAAPALIRTAMILSRRSQRGEVISVGDRSVLFMASMGGVLLACMAAFGTFFIACAATCFGLLSLQATQSVSGLTGENVFTIALGLCVLLSFAVGVLVLRRTWAQK